jgi:hypothetical protein
MRVLSLSVLGVATALALLAGGCRKDTSEAEMHARIVSGLGVNVSFGQSPTQTQAVLGQPTATTTRGKRTEDHYVAPNPDNATPAMPDLEATQLTLSFYDSKLVRVYNRYHPELEGAKNPPFVLEPVPGAKLGNKRSQLEAALGPPNYGELKDGWRFAAEDGATVTVLPQYTEVPSLGESLVSALTVSYIATGADPGRGEYFDKKQQVQDSLHNR